MNTERTKAMAKRFEAKRRLPAAVLLPDVPAPALSSRSCCELVAALCVCLRYCGTETEYDELMVLTGRAFAAPDDYLEAEGPSVCRRMRLPAAVSDLGWEGRLWDDPDMCVLEIVKGEIDAGRPLLALGWGPIPQRWAVIAGYDAKEQLICGHPYGNEQGAYVGAPAVASLLVSLGEPGARLQRIEAMRHAVRWAVQQRQEDHWAGWFRRWEDDEGWLEAGNVRQHDLAVERLLDARTAAARWLGAVGSAGDDLFHAWLTAAATHWERLVEALETRHPPLLSPESTAAFSKTAWRSAWLARLREAAGLDDEAIRCLRLALEADYPPPLGV